MGPLLAAIVAMSADLAAMSADTSRKSADIAAMLVDRRIMLINTCALLTDFFQESAHLYLDESRLLPDRNRPALRSAELDCGWNATEFIPPHSILVLREDQKNVPTPERSKHDSPIRERSFATKIRNRIREVNQLAMGSGLPSWSIKKVGSDGPRWVQSDSS